MKDYLIAAALGNGNLRRFAGLARKLKTSVIVFHFFVVALALHFPVMFAIVRLPPWEFYARLYGSGFAAALDESGLGAVFAEAAAPNSDTVFGEAARTAETISPSDESAIRDFNTALYAGGYGVRVILPALGFTFLLIVILQAAFSLLAAFFLRTARLASSPLSYRECLSIITLSSTLPAAAAALFGLWLPTVHLVIFSFAEIILAFAILRVCDE
jgi:hypothetical protein